MAKKFLIKDAESLDIIEMRQFIREFDLGIPEKRDMKNSHIIVARDVKTKQLLGFMQLSYADSQTVEIKKLAVRRQFRDSGVGRKLASVARAIAINSNLKLKLSAREDPVALRFWRDRQKFKETNESIRNGNRLSKDFELKAKAIPRKRKTRIP
jgi:ribosomal protein S18 acetylase RimI-like enzyme